MVVPHIFVFPAHYLFQKIPFKMSLISIYMSLHILGKSAYFFEKCLFYPYFVFLVWKSVFFVSCFLFFCCCFHFFNRKFWENVLEMNLVTLIWFCERSQMWFFQLWWMGLFIDVEEELLKNGSAPLEWIFLNSGFKKVRMNGTKF